MATLWAKRVTYDSVQIGDDLPILVKHESQKSINNYARLASTPPSRGRRDLQGGEVYGKGNKDARGTNSAEATAAYVAELLEKAFPLKVLMGHGSRLEMRATEPIRTGDTITFTGEVTGKREEDGQGIVDCEIAATNQSDQIVAHAKATISFLL